MSLIKDIEETKVIYEEAASRGVCIAAFCAEHPFMVEAAVKAAYELGQELGIKKPPVVIAFTGNYQPRPQMKIYSALAETRKVESLSEEEYPGTGPKFLVQDVLVSANFLFQDIATAAWERGPYGNIITMAHLDHGQGEKDVPLWSTWSDHLSSVMIDYSHLALNNNIKKTGYFVKEHKDEFLIEGAVDEIFEAGSGKEKNKLTSVADARRYFEETGVYFIAPNLGTEHRATRAVAKYDGKRAQEISGAVGRRIVLHGTSSLSWEDITRLKDDGICRVNIWTDLEKTGATAVTKFVIRELGNILNEEEMRTLLSEGYLGERYLTKRYIEKTCQGKIAPKISAIPLSTRRDVWMEAVVKRMKEYMRAFGYANLAK